MHTFDYKTVDCISLNKLRLMVEQEYIKGMDNGGCSREALLLSEDLDRMIVDFYSGRRNDRIKLNRESLKILLHVRFGGNYSAFARELDVDISHIYRVIKYGTGGGKKIIGAVMNFCRREGLSFEEYIEI